ncbi:MAG: glycosyltransferase [Pseudomonadota bacterium]
MAPDVSLIVVSRDREEDLCALISILKVQHKTRFELIIVSNIHTDRVLSMLGDRQATVIYCDVQNIAVMRNLGLSAACAPVVAFCDDDAIPEPDWLFELSSAFDNPTVCMATGPVLGRNGFSLQWGVTRTDWDGLDTAVDTVPQSAELYAPSTAGFVRVQGTNCAFKRETLLQIGGFDKGFAYYLDETDVCIRLAKRGHATAFQPTAVVQHQVSSSATRYQNRAPKSLALIGESIRHFVACHADSRDVALRRHYLTQEHRLLRNLESGVLEPRDIKHRRSELYHGQAEPAGDVQGKTVVLADGLFCDTTTSRMGVVIATTRSRKGAADQYAKSMHLQGKIVTMLVMSALPFRHRRAAWDGIYTQNGGVMGLLSRSPRSRARSPLKCAQMTTKSLEIRRSIARMVYFVPFGMTVVDEKP